MTCTIVYVYPPKRSIQKSDIYRPDKTEVLLGTYKEAEEEVEKRNKKIKNGGYWKVAIIGSF